MKRPRYQKEFSDAAIRRFLLGRLRPRDQSAFENALFTNLHLEHRVRLAELEVTDDYLFRRLRRAETAKFEKEFLCTGARRKLLSGSRALKKRFEVSNQTARAIELSSANGFFQLHQTKLRLAFAFGLAVLFIATGWLVIRKEPQITREITRRFMRRPAVTQPTPVETHHTTNTSEAQHQETPQPLPEHAVVTPSALTIALWPNDVANASSFSISSTGYEQIQFELNVKAQPASRYRVEVLTAQGQSVFVATAESASASLVKFAAPRTLFKTGTFEIRLVDDNSKATVATYYFRVE